MVLGRAGTEARLPEERGLLVPGDARDRHSRRYWADRAGPRPNTGGREYLWQHRRGYVERCQQLVVPRQAVEIEEQRARSVGGVGGVEPAAGQPPDQPRVHRAEGYLAGRGAPPQLRVLVEQPSDLRAGEVGIEHQAGPFTEQRAKPGLL